MTLKEFMDAMYAKSPINAMTTVRDLIELEGLSKKFQMMWGVDLDIKVKPWARTESQFIGKGVLDSLNKEFPNIF